MYTVSGNREYFSSLPSLFHARLRNYLLPSINLSLQQTMPLFILYTESSSLYFSVVSLYTHTRASIIFTPLRLSSYVIASGSKYISVRRYCYHKSINAAINSRSRQFLNAVFPATSEKLRCFSTRREITIFFAVVNYIYFDFARLIYSHPLRITFSGGKGWIAGNPSNSISLTNPMFDTGIGPSQRDDNDFMYQDTFCKLTRSLEKSMEFIKH